MHRLNKPLWVISALGAAWVSLIGSACMAAERIQLHKGVTPEEARCFRELFRERQFDYASPGEIDNFIAETEAGRADLTGLGQNEFIFVVHDIGYCGSAGCMMLIGKQSRDNKCHMLAEASSDGGEVVVLRRRDHGYRRLYAPCELYFDGRQYQQVREKCPNADVRR